jgi:DNA-binding NarL/FixJ family response regulator
MSLRVAVVEDHPATRFGLVTMLDMAEDIEVVGEFGAGRETLDNMAALQPDVVIQNVGLPDIPGEQVAEEIRQMGSDTKVAAFSVLDDEEHIMSMLNAGALGYILKTEPPPAILEAIRSIAEGAPWLSSKAFGVVMNFRLGELPECPELTGRELDVLQLLPQGYTNRQIAESLVVSETTVKNHLTNIYSKLGVKRRAGAIAWAWQHGLVSL